MAKGFLESLKTLADQRRALQRKELRIRAAERRVMEKVDGWLSSFGYRLISSDGGAPRARALAGPRRGLPKTIKCPKCDRRFSRQMHVARHLNAMHGRENNVKSPARRSGKSRR